MTNLLGNVTDSISENVESTTQFIGGKKEDEYFCKETKDYRICRHCSNIDDSGKVIHTSQVCSAYKNSNECCQGSTDFFFAIVSYFHRQMNTTWSFKLYRHHQVRKLINFDHKVYFLGSK